MEHERLVDPSAYRRAPLKILWLLKEMNDPRHETEGMIPMIRKLLEIGHIQRGAFPTCGPIAKVSYGLLHADDPWDRWASDQANYICALKAIAIVNLKDKPGGRTSVPAEIMTAFQSRKHEIRDEIADLRPHVLIGGNTLHFCGEWFPEWRPQPPGPGQYDSRLIDETIWVQANHPARRGRGWSHHGYFERIREAVERQRALT